MLYFSIYVSDNCQKILQWALENCPAETIQMCLVLRTVFNIGGKTLMLPLDDMIH